MACAIGGTCSRKTKDVGACTALPRLMKLEKQDFDVDIELC